MLNLTDKLLGFDCEATGLNPWGDVKRWGFYPARPFAFSFSDSSFNTEYYRFPVDPMTREVLYKGKPSKFTVPQFQQTTIRIKTLLEDPRIIKIGHYIGYDIRMCHHIGIEVKGEIHDTLIMAHTVTGGSLLSYGLKELGVKIADFPIDDEKDLKEATRKARQAGKKLGWALATKKLHGRDPIKADYWMAPDALCKRYAIQDAQRTMLFFKAWYEKIMNDPNMKRVYEREMALTRVVAKMENRGTRFIPEQAAKLRKFYEAYQLQQLIIAKDNGGMGLNFRSPTQMVRKFIDEKGYEGIYFTPKGNPKINGDTLKFWHENKGDKLAGAILESKGASHMISGFLDPYERFKVKENENTWVLHPNYRQCGPITGRLACGDPNLMQVASPTTGRRRTEITLRPREAFGPRDGYIWYVPDYCLHPSTMVETLTGSKPISSIKTGEKVLTLRNRKIHYGKVTKSTWVENLPSFKLTFDNGESIIASSDHMWPTQSSFKVGEQSKITNKKTCDLRIGERMVPFKKGNVGAGYETWYSLDGALSNVSAHRLVAEAYMGKLPKGHHTHHKDGNKKNNHPSNLEYVLQKTHASNHFKETYKVQDHAYRIKKLKEGIHAKRDYHGNKNPNYGKKATVKLKELISKSCKKFWRSNRSNVARQNIVRSNIERGSENHKLIKMEYVGFQPMYAITVEPDHNYVLSCGVVTKNCQIEVWVFSFLAKEQAMCEALLQGRDFHGAVAEKVWGKLPTFVSDHSYFRKRAKLLMFCKLYGGGVNKVAYLTDSTVDEAEKFVGEFDAQLPGISRYMKRMTTKAEREGKIVNPLGRTYYIDPDFSYRAVNYMVQGTAADILKNAMIRIDVLFTRSWPDCHILLTLHDELVLEIPLKFHSKRLMREIITEMQQDSAEIGIPVPLPVGMKIAKKYWSDTIEIESLTQEWKDKFICKKTS